MTEKEIKMIKCENCGNKEVKIINTIKGHYLCGQCGRDTERLYEIEHDAEIRAKAIDEFRVKVNKEIHMCFSDDLEIQKHIDKIAEQMKGSEE